MNKNSSIGTKSTGSKRSGLEIAVIGMAGRFPGAKNIDEFWNNIKNGKECLSFFSDEELEKLSPELRNHPDFVGAKGGILEDMDFFDAHFFDYSPMEAEVLDPQIRIFLESCWEALENAGYDPLSYEGLIGLYGGNSMNFDWEGLVLLSGKSSQTGSFAAAQLTNREFFATSVSYKLNLQGPAFLVQAACSTSLAAIHVGCRALLTGECGIALCGGAGLFYSERKGYIYREGMVSSADGHCRAFDAKASGTIFGEGVGVVVLKSLKDALSDGDYIHAVVKGSAANNDGMRKVGFSAPSVNGQAEVIRAAHRFSRVEPESITYVETHGTGTKLGDPIEVKALTKAFDTDSRGFCGIGSVKTNIGHLDAAAGVAGFIKTVMALKNRQIPPSLNYTNPNPEIDFENSPFYVNTRLKEWQNNNYPLRAGVSALGIGGTNVHVVLEQAPVISHSSLVIGEKRKERDYQLILLSAKTQSALEKISQNLAVHLEKNPGIHLADAAYTLQVGRSSFQYRKLLVCSAVEEAAAALASPTDQAIHTSICKSQHQPVVFMFSGQGSQYVNMGLELYREEKAYKEEIDRCFDILEHMGYHIKDILYPRGNVEEAEENINRIVYSFPIKFAVEYAAARLLIKWGIKPYAMIGPSFGEYIAACLSGVFTLEDALFIVVARGELIDSLPKGAMLSVPLSGDQLKPLLNPDIELASVNGPAHCIVSGTDEAIHAFEKQLNEKGYECGRLRVPRAGHSKMMDPILEQLENKFRQVKLNPPKIPYISGVTGKWITDEQATDPHYWARHSRETVRFYQGMNQLFKEENTIFVQVGSDRSLSTLYRNFHFAVDCGTRLHQETNENRHQRFAQHIGPPCHGVNLLRHPRDEVSDVKFLLHKIGLLWLYGKEPDWKAFYHGQTRSRVPLPTYPFERQRYWIEGDLYSKGSELLSQNYLVKKPDITDWFYIPSWTRSLPLAQRIENLEEKSHWVLFIDEQEPGLKIKKILEQQGQSVIAVKPGPKFKKVHNRVYDLNPARENDYESLLAQLPGIGKGPLRIIHLWSVTAGGPGRLDLQWINHLQDRGLYSLVYLARALGNKEFTGKVQIQVVINHLQDISGEESPDPGKATILGPVKVIPLEYPNITCRCIDILPPKPGSKQEEKVINQLLSEFSQEFHGPLIAYRGNHRWEQTVKPVLLEKPEPGKTPLKEKGVYLVIGGLGGIGLKLAGYLAKAVKARLILTGRSAFPPRREWEKWLDTHGEDDVVSTKIQKVRELEALGAEVLVCSADIANRQQMQAVIAQSMKRFGPINGVIHSGGVPGGGVIQRKTREMMESVLSSKVTGSLLLNTLFKDVPLDFMIFCSSASTFLPWFGQVDYVAANAFLDALANCPDPRETAFTTAINWGRWGNIGMAQVIEKKHREMTGEDFQDAMTGEEGVEAFSRILARGRFPQLVVMERDLPAMIERYHKGETQEMLEEEVKVKEAETSAPPSFHRPALSTSYASPGNRTEKLLADTWQQFFGYRQVGIDDDFFELGGDSLKATMLVSTIHKELQVKIPLARVFKTPTIKELAQYISGSEKETFISIAEAEKKEYYPLSPAQKRIYLLQEREPETTAYNLYMFTPLEKETEVEKIEEVFRKLIQRHESLRTSFELINEEPVQRIHDNIEFEIQRLAAPEDTDSAGFPAHGVRPFDLSAAPLLRVELIETNEGTHTMMVDMHHSIADGVSHDILIEDFMALYRDKKLPGLRLQYKDYSQWQNGLSQNPTEREAIKRQEEFWLKEFAKEVPLPNIPVDYGRSRTRKLESETITFEITKENSTALRKIARQEDATMFMVLITIYYIFISKITNQEDIVIGTAAGGRMHAELDRIIGMFTNFLALRNYPKPGKTFREFFKEITKRMVDAFDNQYYQFHSLVEKLKLKRNPARTPLFEVAFSFHNLSQEDSSSPVLEVTSISGFNKKPYGYQYRKSNYDLVLHVLETKEKLSLTFEYVISLFKRESIEKFIDYFKKITASVVDNPGIRISEIEIIAKEEKYRLLEKVREKKGKMLREDIKKSKEPKEKIEAEFDF